jgi:hypothetical protein
MAFKVTDFKSNLKGGGARPSLFYADLDAAFTKLGIPFPNKSQFLIKGTTIPASTLGTYEVFFHGKSVKVAGDRTFDTWDTTIINDEDFGIRHAIENWMELISNHKLNTRDTSITSKLEGENADYKQTLSVTQFGKGGKGLRKYDFLGAFPTALSTINLDWGTADIEEYTCTWTYDRWRASSFDSTGTAPKIVIGDG